LKVIGNEDQDGKFVATASGTLSNGAVVTINSAGTVSVISDTNQLLGDSVDPSGSGSAPSHTSVTYDPDTDRYILFYNDGGNNSYGTAVVGQVDGTTITFGTPVVFITGVTYYNSCDYDTNQNKVVNAYQNMSSNGWGYVITGTVNASDNSISFATPVAFESASVSIQASHIYLHFVSGQNKIVIGYKEVTSNSYDGWGIAGEVQANGSVTFGTRQQFLNNTGNDLYLAVNSEGNRIIFAYSYGNTGVVRCAELSGTSLAMNSSQVQFMTSMVTNIDVTFDSNRTRHIIAFRKNDSYGYVISTSGLTGSGSSVTTTFPMPAVAFTGNATDQISISYNPDVRRCFIGFRDSSNNLQVRQIKLYIYSGNPVIRLDYDQVQSNANNIEIQSAGDDYTSNYGGGKICTLYRSSNESSAVRSRILQPEDKKIFPSPNTIIGSGISQSYYTMTYDTTNKRLVYAYRNTSTNKGMAVVATHVGGTSGITSVGTPVQFSNNQTADMAMTFHPEQNRVIICFKDNGDSGKFKVVAGSVDKDNNSISFGSVVQLSNGASFFGACCYVPTMNRIFACWRDENNSSKLYGTSINVSGTTCSIASIQQVVNYQSDAFNVAYNSVADRVVISFQDANNYPTLIAGTPDRDNAAVVFGTPVIVAGVVSSGNNLCYDSTNDRIIVTYTDDSASEGKVAVASQSQSNFTLGAINRFRSGTGFYNQVVHDPDSNKIIFLTSDNSNFMRYNIGTINAVANTISITESDNSSGNGFNFACDYQQGAANVTSSIVYNPDKKATVFSWESGGAGKTSILTVGASSLKANNVIGISDGDHADTTNATVNLANSISRNRTGITAGQTHFVLSDGSISTTAGDPSVPVGTGISTTELIIEG
tara:strand:- start:41198 stop:43825 length:2628 start_codon:yes stop_codon:yes gene_type:complete